MSVLEDLFYREYGREQEEAPTVVFIHGLLGWGLNWSPIIKHFEKDFHILTYDQRGHGRSFHPSSYQVEDYAQDLYGLLKAKGIKKAHIVGHSLGGRVAQCFAVKHPGHTLSLVIEDMGPNPEPETTESTRKMIEKVPVPFASKEDMDQYFEEEFSSKTASSEKQKNVMAQFLKANLQRQKDGEISWRFSLQGVMESLEDGLTPRWTEFKCLQVPTLILRGAESEHLTQQTLELMLECLPAAQGQSVEGSGHWIHYQKPKEFSSHVLQFLQNLE